MATGKPKDVVNRYVGLVHEYEREKSDSVSSLGPSFRHGDGTSVIEDVKILNAQGEAAGVVNSGEKMTVQVDLSDRSVAEDDSPPSPTQPQQSKTDTKVELMSLPSERSQPANSFDLKFEISDLKFQMTIHRTP